MHRREFLRLGGSLLLGSLAGSSLWARPLLACPAQTGMGPYGNLLPPDANGIQLPPGFRSRVVARAGQLVENSTYTWHALPDGAAVFPVSGGYIYVSNSEVGDAGGGGVGAIRFDHQANIDMAWHVNLIVDRVNGRRIGSLEDLIAAFEAQEGPYHVMEFGYYGRMGVLDRAVAEEAHQDILDVYGIPQDRRL